MLTGQRGDGVLTGQRGTEVLIGQKGTEVQERGDIQTADIENEEVGLWSILLEFDVQESGKHGSALWRVDQLFDVKNVAGMCGRSVHYITSQLFHALYW